MCIVSLVVIRIEPTPSAVFKLLDTVVVKQFSLKIFLHCSFVEACVIIMPPKN